MTKSTTTKFSNLNNSFFISVDEADDKTILMSMNFIFIYPQNEKSLRFT